MSDFQAMVDAGAHLPEHIRPWLLWMQVILFVGPIVFIRYRAARWLILAQIVNVVVAYSVFVAEGNDITKLFGLGHFAWLIPLWFFVRDIPTDKWLAYRVYAGIAAMTIAISLVFDVRDTAQWILGDRGSLLVYDDP